MIKMQLYFKTVDHKAFTMEVDMEGGVEDLIFKLDGELGQDNIYQLFYAGKVLEEDRLLCDYNISNQSL